MNDEKAHLTAQPSAITLKLDWFALTFWGIVILAAILRFYDLAGKPFHHDESLYSVYCWRFFKGEGYMYDPMMHGPFMFLFQGLIFFLFGVGDFSARIMPALLGTAMIAGTYLLKDILGKIGVIFVALVLTLSPTHLYFSRFMREDIYVAFFIYMATVCGLLYYRTRTLKYFYLTAAALSLMFCVKESSYIHAFIFITFVFVKDVWNSLLGRTKAINARTLVGWFGCAIITLGCVVPLAYFSKHALPDTLSALNSPILARVLLVLPQLVIGVWMVVYWMYEQERFTALRLTPKTYGIILGAAIFIAIYVLLYSTLFQHPKGVVDGLARSWIYWWNQHSIQRIKGPFHYYVPFIFLYELPIFLIAGAGVLLAIVNNLNKTIIAVWAILFSGFITWKYGGDVLPLAFAPTHMEIWADFVLALLVLGFGLWATVHFLARHETCLAFFTYSAALGFLIYAYAGEKVPWLFLHILVPVVLLAGILVQRIFVSAAWRDANGRLRNGVKIAVILACTVFGLYTLHSTILLNYYHSANPVETMVYTQTSTDMLKLLQVVADVKFSIGSEEAKKPYIAVQGNAVWPLAWYLRDVDGWFFPGDLMNIDRPLVVMDWESREQYRKVFEQDYQEIRFKLREWWIPQAGGTWRQWKDYFLYRKVFNPTGSSDVLLYVKR